MHIYWRDPRRLSVAHTCNNGSTTLLERHWWWRAGSPSQYFKRVGLNFGTWRSCGRQMNILSLLKYFVIVSWQSSSVSRTGIFLLRCCILFYWIVVHGITTLCISYTLHGGRLACVIYIGQASNRSTVQSSNKWCNSLRKPYHLVVAVAHSHAQDLSAHISQTRIIMRCQRGVYN